MNTRLQEAGMLLKWITNGSEAVHRATSEHERDAIFRFRYRVYVDELGKDVSSADHEHRRIHDLADDAPGTVLFYTGSLDDIGGTVRVQVWRPGTLTPDVRDKYTLEMFPAIDRHAVCETTRLVVTRDLRGRLIVPALAKAGFEHFAPMPGYFCFANCAPGLVRAYRRLGYRPYDGRLISVGDGLRIPMVLVTSDRAYLREMHSPVLALCKRTFQADGVPPIELAPYADVLHAAAASFEVDSDDVWRMVQDELVGSSPAPSRLFQGISTRGVRKLTEKGFAMEVDSQQVITRESLLEREIFVILDGQFEVLEHGRRVRVLEKGEVFGEIAFFLDSGRRTATIRSITAGRLLILRRRFIDELLEEDPALAARLLQNLGRVLAARLAYRILQQPA